MKTKILVCCFVGWLCAVCVGQQTLDQLPSYQRMQKVNEEIQKLIVRPTIKDIEWSSDGKALLFERDGKRLRMELASYQTEPTEERGAGQGTGTRQAGMMEWDASVGRAEQRTVEKAPNGLWEAVYQDFNVVLRQTDEGKKANLNEEAEIQVTRDGHERHRFGTCCWVYGEELYQSRAMWWSPDSQKLVFYEVNEEGMRDYFLTTGNTDNYTDILAVRYPIAGDANPKVSLWVYDLTTKESKRLHIPGDETQYLYKISFAPSGNELIVHRTNRRQNVLDLLAVDVETGNVRTIVQEVQETWQNNNPTIQFLADGKRFIWETEKNGFKHFELRSLDGQLLNPLSQPESYPCEQIVLVDEEAGYFYYTAYSDDNPLNQQLHRVRLDGSDHRRLTAKPFNYTQFYIAPNHQHFVASYEAVDVPPVAALHNAAGEELKILDQGDMQQAIAAGLSPAELFHFTADDGKTEIYGILFKPVNFDPQKKYPLVIDVYGGPQSRGVNNRFQPYRRQCELGFLIAQIGNRGTIGRGKAFEEATYKNLGTADLQDQADGVKFLARRDYVDGGRVGIYGHSYGGFMAASAVLRHPDLFHVAVSGAPVTDWRNYDTIYTERYMQTPQENSEGYANGDCCKYAENLKGKLLIVHGLVDDNVHPVNTWRLSEALHNANKRFDMMVYPNFDHGIGSTYGQLIWEYLIEHLQPEPLTTIPEPLSKAGSR